MRYGQFLCDHSTEACGDRKLTWERNDATGGLRYSDWKKGCRFQNGAGVCVYCWTPQTPFLHGKRTSQHTDCQNDGIIPQVCFGMWIYHQNHIVHSGRYPGLDGNTTFATYSRWLTEQPIGDDGVRARPNAVLLFVRGCRYLDQLG